MDVCRRGALLRSIRAFLGLVGVLCILAGCGFRDDRGPGEETGDDDSAGETGDDDSAGGHGDDDSAGGPADIRYNATLADLVGLSSLSAVGHDLYLLGNACLSQEEADAFAASIDTGGAISVQDNNGPCP